jgi:integrase
MAKFLIDSKKTEGEATIFIRVRRRGNKEHESIDMLVNTHLYCSDAKKWINDYINGDSEKYRYEHKDLFNKLDTVRNTIDELVEKGVYSKQIIDAAVLNIINKELHEYQERERIETEKEKEAERHDILNMYNEFFTGISDGDIKHGKDKTYSKGSITIWKSFGVYLNGFYNKHYRHGLTFEMIDKSVSDKFTKYLDKDIKLMPKTVVKNVICFRALCIYAAKIMINHNAASLKCWDERDVKDGEMRAATYLNDKELASLYDMPLTGERERTRDMFVLGTLLCQRYSDYMNLWKDNLNKPLDDGTLCCRLTQQKTGTSVVIPFYDDRMVAICKKYKYNFPHVKDLPLQSFNRYLKLIMKELASSVPSLNDMFTTVLTSAERRKEERYKSDHNGALLYERNSRGQVVKPKWDVITGHSARRSGITQLYERHVLTTRQMMNISGHATESIFLKYIKTSADNEAKETAKALKGI